MSRSIDLGRIRFYHRGTYSASASYELNDVVAYGGSSYVYTSPTITTGNTPVNTTYWAKMAEGFDVRGAWVTGTNYFLNDIVTYGNSVYICTVIHTASVNFDTDRVANYWSLLVEGTNWRGTWATATGYFAGDVVIYGNNLYYAEVNHTSGTFATDLSTNKLSLQTRGFKWESAWATSTAYQLNDIVTYGSYVYVCIVEHTSGTFTTDLAASKWQLLTSGFRWRGTYAPSTQYLQGDAVFYGGNTYSATATFTSDSSSFNNDTNWTLLAQGALGGEVAVQTNNANKLLTTNGTTTLWTDSISVSEVTANVQLFAGSQAEGFSASAGLTNPIAVFRADVNDYAQLSFVNDNAGSDASSDIIVYANNGDDTSGWIDMGITSSTFNDPSFSTTTANDGYIFMSAPAGGSGRGNLVLATDDTGTENKIVLAAGGLASGSEQLSVTPTGIEVIGDIDSQGAVHIAGTGIITVGDDAEAFSTSATLTNPVAVFSADQNDFSQVAFVNVNSGSSSSADYIAYADNGDDDAGWIDMGITSSTYSDPSFTSTGPNDGYIFMEAPAGTTGKGNLVIATGSHGSENKIVFAAGGLLSDNEQMSITPDQNVHIEIATQSTSPTNGALTVVGGVGVAGNLNVLGNANITGAITVGGGQFASENLSVTDPLVFVGNANTADLFDLGIVGEYKLPISLSVFPASVSRSASVTTVNTTTAHNLKVGDTVNVNFTSGGSTITAMNGSRVVTSIVDSDTYTFAFNGANISLTSVTGTTDATARRYFQGIVRDASDDVIKVFENLDLKPSTEVDFTNASLQYSAVRVGSLAGNPSFSGTPTFTTGASLSGTFSGNPTLSGTPTFSGSPNFSGGASLSGAFTGNPTISGNPTLSGSPDFTGTPVFNGSPTFSASVSFGSNGGSLGSGTFSGSPTFSGNPTFTGIPTFSNPSTAFSNGASLGSGTFTGNPTFNGNPTFSGTPVFSGNPSFTGTPVFSGGVRVQEMIEDVVDASITTNVCTVDYTTGNIFFVTTTPTANFNLTINNVPTDNGRITTVNVIVTQGATGYIPSTITVNNVAQTLRWAAGVTPTPTSSAGKVDIFTFSLLRRSNAYTVLGSANLNF